MGVRREAYDEVQAAGRLRVPLAAWRWAAGTGLVPPPDAGPGQWSRAVVEAADPEAVRAALRGPVGAGWAADRLTDALGVPLPPRRPRVTAAAVGHLVRAGLLVRLGGDAEFPEVHPDQVQTLARRRDLPALLDHHVPIGPDQAAVRLGVRRTDFDHLARLGWAVPVGTAAVDYGRAYGGVVQVPLYSAAAVALLPQTRPHVDWRQVRRTGPGRRSPLAALEPAAPADDTAFLAEVARIAGVGRAAVVAWRRRLPGFPDPVAGTDVHPRFDRRAVDAWLLAHDKLTVPHTLTTAVLSAAGPGVDVLRVRLADPELCLADDVAGTDRVSGWVEPADADALTGASGAAWGMTVRRLSVPGSGAVAVTGDVRVTERAASAAGVYIELSWPARVRGRADCAAGIVRHGLPYAPGEGCPCARHACGGIVPASWCEHHGMTVAPVMEWHPGGGIRCTELTQAREGALTPAP